MPLILLLCLLTGCGKDSKASGTDAPVDTVADDTDISASGDDEAVTSALQTTTAGGDAAAESTAAVTTRAVRRYTDQIVTVFYGPGVLVPDYGEDYNVYGTVSPVPVAEVPATTTAALIDPTVDPEAPAVIEPEQPAQQQTQEHTYDPKDQSVISFEITSSGVNVLRGGSAAQTLSADTSLILPLISGGAYSQSQLLIEEDFDFDGYRDLFVAENVAANMNGRYFRYDSSTGTYSDWQALNDVNWYVTANSAEGTLAAYIKYGTAEYENRVYKWSGGTLALVSMEKQYQSEDGSIYLDHYDYSSGVANLYLREQYVDGKYMEVPIE